MASENAGGQHPAQDISQLDGTVEVAGYIGGATAAVRIGASRYEEQQQLLLRCERQVEHVRLSVFG
jgi:hypothetical protein